MFGVPFTEDNHWPFISVNRNHYRLVGHNDTSLCYLIGANGNWRRGKLLQRWDQVWLGNSNKRWKHIVNNLHLPNLLAIARYVTPAASASSRTGTLDS
jgi:hypothetical protein